MNDLNNLMVWFELAIGVYLVFVAITGKGKAYENDYPKGIKDEVFKMNRIMYAVAGPILIISAVIELLIPIEIVHWISIGVIIAIFAAYIIIVQVRFGKVIKEAKKSKF